MCCHPQNKRQVQMAKKLGGIKELHLEYTDLGRSPLYANNRR